MHHDASSPVVTERGVKSPDWLASLVLYIPALSATILSKLAFHTGAGQEVTFGVPLIIGSTALGVATRRLVVHPKRFVLYASMAMVLLLQQALAVDTFSLPSIVLVLLLHSPYAFALPEQTAHELDVHLKRFLDLSLFIAILGLVQFPAQFIIGAKYAFPVDFFIPDQWLAKQFNALNPMSYGSTTYKTTGVFMLEPSCYSMFMALSCAVEFASKRRLARLACYCMGLMLAYSGTGLIVLGFAIPTLIVAHREYRAIPVILIGVLAVLALSKPLGLDYFLERTGEFSAEGSSFHARYVAGPRLWEQYLWDDPTRSLFGVGAGMMDRMSERPVAVSAQTGWVKITLEYGLVGAAFFYAFLLGSVLSTNNPAATRISLLVMILLASVLDSYVHGLVISLLIWQEQSKAPAAAATQLGALRPHPR